MHRRRRAARQATNVLSWLATAVAALVVVFVGLQLYRKFRRVHQETVAAQRQKPNARPRTFEPDPHESRREDPLPPVLAEAELSVDEAITRLNACLFVREVARLRGETSRSREATDRARSFEERLAREMGKPIQYLRTADRLLIVDDLSLEILEPKDAGNRLARFYQAIYPGQILLAIVERGGAREQVIMHFREAPRMYGGDLPIAAVSYETPEATVLQLSETDRKRILDLPEYYREGVLDAEERARLRRILARGGGSAEEIDFIARRVLGEVAGLAQSERLDFHQIEAELRREIRDSAFDRNLEQASTLHALYEMALGSQRKAEEGICWARILKLDPGFSLARTGLGYVRDLRMGWRREAKTPAVRRDPERTIEFEGVRYTEAQLRSHLRSNGYAEIGAKWHRVEKWEFVLDSVHRLGRLSWAGTDINVQEAKEEGTGVVGHSDPAHGGGPGELKQPAHQRFFAPKGTQGMMKIVVDAPGSLHECSLVAQARVTDGKGSIELLIGENRIYLLEKGSESSIHDISRFVRGEKKIGITVKMKMAADATMQHARFLPSSPDGKEVFVLRGSTATPEPRLDRLFP